MTLAFVLLLIAAGGELILWRIVVDSRRRVWAVVCMLLLLVSIISSFLAGYRPWFLLEDIFSVYRIINLYRVVRQRLNPEYVFEVMRRSSRWLMLFQIILSALVIGLNRLAVTAQMEWYALSVIQILFAFSLVLSLRRNLRTTDLTQIEPGYADADLPTLTIAIPARNETDDLDECLQTLVASTYPKLEILVLDDCSQNKRTPEIIRSFAHDGVQFIAGTNPPDHWLAKNYAYQQLLEAANGELIAYCGVDTRFQPDSLRLMVEVMLNKKKSMISWVPRNAKPTGYAITPLLIQPFRYGWELCLARRRFHRPPVLSTCWFIKRATLEAAGTFKSVSRSISPESYLTHYSAVHEDGYSFLQANAQVGLLSMKSYAEQRATAVRTRYPQLHRRLELVALISLAELITLLVPLLVCLTALVYDNRMLALLGALSSALLIGVFVSIVRITYRMTVWRSVWLLPVAVLYDVGLLNYSMWQYEFSEVIWKGRNICIPVMRVLPYLPKL